MKYAQKIEELERAIFGCLHCNRCHYGQWPDNNEICPLFTRDRCFTHSAGGLMYLARHLSWGSETYPMSGVLPVDIEQMERPQGHGYDRSAQKDQFLRRPGRY